MAQNSVQGPDVVKSAFVKTQMLWSRAGVFPVDTSDVKHSMGTTLCLGAVPPMPALKEVCLDIHERQENMDGHGAFGNVPVLFRNSLL